MKKENGYRPPLGRAVSPARTALPGERRRVFAWACSAVLAMLFCAGARAQHYDEGEVKAAFLFKFGGYVQWPESAFARPESPVVIAVAGSTEVYEHLLHLSAGRSYGRRPIAVRRLLRGDPVGGVHILFIASGAEAEAELLERTRGRPVLVVTESKSGQRPGSVIDFVTTGDRVRFDVSLEAADANGLRLSALLLSAARTVRGKPS